LKNSHLEDQGNGRIGCKDGKWTELAQDDDDDDDDDDELSSSAASVNFKQKIIFLTLSIIHLFMSLFYHWLSAVITLSFFSHIKWLADTVD
jgi:hypothetical protein